MTLGPQIKKLVRKQRSGYLSKIQPWNLEHSMLGKAETPEQTLRA